MGWLPDSFGVVLTGQRFRVAVEPLQVGDRVTWRSHGQTVHGRVEEEITSRVVTAGRLVAASAGAPQYRVRSDKGGDAVHRPEALRRERQRP